VRNYLDNAWGKMRRDGRDIAEEALRRDIARDLGWPPEDFLAFTLSQQSQDRYQASTQQAHARGVFGVPTMIVDDEMWWGNDRLDFLEEFLKSSSADDRRAAS
jgi:2-hydroxychromene-2-carboxylate isomerase